MRLALAAAVCTVLLLPAASPAAGVATLGQGSRPGVAIDDAGTAYVAWIGPQNLSNSLEFCKVARGGGACPDPIELAVSGNSLTSPYVAVSGSRVVVAQYRYQEKAGDQQGIYEWISNDGGATFDGGRQIGTVPFTDAVAGPGDTLSVVTDAVTEGELFQNVPLDGTATDDGARALLSGDHPYRGSVGLVDAATPVVISTDGNDNAQFRRYSGSGSLDDAASWTPASDIGTFAYSHLAGGPEGLFGIGGTGDRRLGARKWTGSGFSAPASIGEADVPNSHLVQDGGGRLHAVYNHYDADGLHLEHAVSDDGAAWRVGTVLIQQVATDGGIGNPRAAVARDHVGVVAWEAGAGTKEVRLTAIGPDAPKPVIKSSSSARRSGGGVVVTIRGRLVPPANLTKTQACGGGKVRVALKRGARRVASREVAVGATCAFKLKTKLSRSRVKGARKLRAGVRFIGNDALAPTARSQTVKIR
jgi:hypothetical protein